MVYDVLFDSDPFPFYSSVSASKTLIFEFENDNLDLGGVAPLFSEILIRVPLAVWHCEQLSLAPSPLSTSQQSVPLRLSILASTN